VSSIALLSRPEAVPPEQFWKDLLTRLEPLSAAVSARLYTADVDQTPLTRAPENQTRRPHFEAALLLEGDDLDLPLVLSGLGELRAYQGRSRVIKRPGEQTPPGRRTPGFTMVSPVFRADAITHERFDRHWGEQHAPLALRHHPGMAAYEQLVIEEPLTPGAAPFDGVALLGFATLEDYTERMFDSQEGRSIIIADTKRFLDLRRSEAVLMSELVLGG
jgi:uncharacterized protein (TIGR02118 family)